MCFRTDPSANDCFFRSQSTSVSSSSGRFSNALTGVSRPRQISTQARPHWTRLYGLSASPETGPNGSGSGLRKEKMHDVLYKQYTHLIASQFTIIDDYNTFQLEKAFCDHR